MRIIFRITKQNRYSVVALSGAITTKKPHVKIHYAESIDEVTLVPPPAVVAYSFMSFDLPWIEHEVKTLSKIGYTLIAGGAHATARPEECLSLGFNHVFVGDGEENILRFIDGERLKIFDGLKKRVALDNYPPFNPVHNMYMPVEISRGCPFNCSYCETPLIAGRKVRHRSIDSVVHYAKIGLKNGKRVARFISSNAFAYGSENGVTPNVEFIELLLFQLKKLNMREIYFGTFPSDVRPESVTQDVLKVLRKYVKNRHIIIGAQSGSNAILRRIKRGHTVETVNQAVEVILENGFIPVLDFIFGFPFETNEDIEQTVSLIKRLIKQGAKIHAHTFMPLPGTELENAGAGDVPKDLRKTLSQLASAGHLNGFWEKQRLLAKQLAKH